MTIHKGRTTSNRKRQCHLCEKLFGQDRALLRHLKKEHGFDDSLTMQEAYDIAFYSGAPPKCACGHCNEIPKWNGWIDGYNKFIIGHNGHLDCLDENIASDIREKRRKSLTGKTGWNKGLTKNSDERLARAARSRSITVKKQFSNGKRQAWNTGLTKDSDERVRKNSEATAQAYADKRVIPWASGLTKDSSEKVAAMAQKVQETMTKPALRQMLDEQKRRSPDRIIKELSDRAPDLVLVSNLDQYVNDHLNNLVFRCKRCGDARQRTLASALTNRCYACCPNASSQQIQINDFIRSRGINTVLNNRTVINPYEIDIWIPHANLAIEYNGLFWHNESSVKGSHYHQHKTDLCTKVGIDLLHIFGDEWTEKTEIVKSMILHRLHQTKHTIFARKCDIVVINLNDRRQFFNENHLDGDVPAKICFGLRNHRGEIVQALSLRKPRQKKYTGMLEIARSCTRINTRVPGGLSRLITAAKKWAREQNNKALMTYVDLRHGSGSGYTSAGFSIIDKTTERWWWTDDVNRFDRFVYRANASLNLTQAQVAASAGVKRIYGCKNLIMQLKL